MSVFLGFYRPDPEYLREVGARRRAGEDGPDPRMQRLVRELPDKVPATCTVLGSYAPMAGAVLGDISPPGVLIVETTNGDDLIFISQYYTGFLQYTWHPARAVGATRQQREAMQAANAVAAGASI